MYDLKISEQDPSSISVEFYVECCVWTHFETLGMPRNTKTQNNHKNSRIFLPRRLSRIPDHMELKLFLVFRNYFSYTTDSTIAETGWKVSDEVK